MIKDKMPKENNKRIINVLPPKMVTFITTFKCTAQCLNCCFQCSPKVTKMMTFSEMKMYLDKCLSVYASSLKVLVITGGECFLLYEDIKRIIKYASEKGLITRIVTNGFWATSYRVAYKKIEELKKNGLEEINFSTGDEHQEWVKFKNIRNASLAAARLGFEAVINIETKDKSKFNIINYLEKDEVFCKFVEREAIKLNSGIWMPYKRNDENISHADAIIYEKVGRCHDLFNNIPINPYGEVLACCGLMAERIKIMRLGNINKFDIKSLYESSFADILKLWIHTEGPYEVLKYIYSLKGENIEKECKHGCEYCREIFSSFDNIRILWKNYHNFSTNILLTYNILYKNN